MEQSSVFFLVIIAYLVMMLAIGFFYSKGNNDSSDFYLGGRKLGPFVTAMSAEASDMSSWLLMGLREWLISAVSVTHPGLRSDLPSVPI